MTWKAKIRNAAGALEDLTLEAPSRAAAFEELRKRGLTALSLAEGGSLKANARRKVASPSPASPASAPSRLRGLVAGLLVILLAAVAVWWFLPAAKPAAPAPAAEKKAPPSRIEEVKPAPAAKPAPPPAATNKVAVAPVPAPAPKTNAAPRKLKLWEKGIRVPKTKPAPPKRFKYDAEEDIAFFFETEPGETIFGEIPFDKRFLDGLRESFKEPVEIKPDDTDEMKELKKSIQEMKVDLEKRMNAGEDIAQLFRDSRHQLIELGNYRRDMINDLMDLAKEEGASRDEFDKFVESVNETLKRKGVKPFTPTPMTYRMLEHSAKKRNLQK